MMTKTRARLERLEVLKLAELPQVPRLLIVAASMVSSGWWDSVPTENGKRGRIVLEQDPLIVVETNGPICREIPWR